MTNKLDLDSALILSSWLESLVVTGRAVSCNSALLILLDSKFCCPSWTLFWDSATGGI